MPEQITLTQDPADPCHWFWYATGNEFICSPSGTPYLHGWDFYVEAEQAWIRWWSDNTTNVFIWTLIAPPSVPPWADCSQADWSIPFDYSFGSFFCLPFSDGNPVPIILNPGQHPGGSVGAMRLPQIDPDCQPEFRRGKPVVPKGKRKG